MIAMQYNIVLPSDYDMSIIVNRIRENGNKTDGFTNLKMKAYLLAEKSKYDNCENQYAPFYLWEKVDGMNQFLLGGPFNNIIHSFGRPVVHNWVVLHEYVVKCASARYAAVQTVPLASLFDCETLLAYERKHFENCINNPATAAYITAYNPYCWELCRFHMASDFEALAEDMRAGLIYDVYHIS